MRDTKEITRPLSSRERVTLWLILLMVRILAPWQYDHQFKEVIEEIVAILKKGCSE